MWTALLGHHSACSLPDSCPNSYSTLPACLPACLPPLQAHGFWGILLLAAYPNAAFDLCGICCGHFLMPFWEFFGATLIGKGGIKVGGRAFGKVGGGGVLGE